MSDQTTKLQDPSHAQKFLTEETQPITENVPVTDSHSEQGQATKRAPSKRVCPSSRAPLLPPQTQTRSPTPSAQEIVKDWIHAQKNKAPQSPADSEISSIGSGDLADDEDSVFDRDRNTAGQMRVQSSLDICDKVNNTVFCLEGNGVCGCSGDCGLRYCVIA